MTLPFSQSCENNKDPILNILKQYFDKPGAVLEIGGGTGQHAEYFAQHMPWLKWQSSDVPSNIDTLNLRLDAAGLAPALCLDVTDSPWPAIKVSYVFTANSLHIMPETAVIELFKHLDSVLLPSARLCVYGPFKYKGEFTSDSNQAFDGWLKKRDPRSGIRDFELIERLAAEAGLAFTNDHSMPANNQFLSFTKEP
ncbi:MAG: DUF938 domain-containing protein [Pseudohongiellaceae bacterium]|nr:DUF938 domain-containing protein [Pseudohongiellaceae bacterium]